MKTQTMTYPIKVMSKEANQVSIPKSIAYKICYPHQDIKPYFKTFSIDGILQHLCIGCVFSQDEESKHYNVYLHILRPKDQVNQAFYSANLVRVDDHFEILANPVSQLIVERQYSFPCKGHFLLQLKKERQQTFLTIFERLVAIIEKERND